MKTARDVTFYLEPRTLRKLTEGRHTFLGLIEQVARDAGMTVHHEPHSPLSQLVAEESPGFSVFRMDERPNERGITVRRSYFQPFWKIERTNERWNWDVARTTFDPDVADPADAAQFVRYWRKRLFSVDPTQARRGGFIYVPLQGFIREHRSFQSCSPRAMVEDIAQRLPDRELRVTLHPKETYSQDDRDALGELARRFPNICFDPIAKEEALMICDAVICQNSGVALSGFFFHKPAVLYGQVDFHHIAGSIPRDGDGAYSALSAEPDYDRYLFWLQRIMSINAQRPDAKARVADRLRALSWPV